MNTIVDARGLSCPQPVIMARQAIEKGIFPIEVRVDTVTSRENVRRMAQANNYMVEVKDDGDDFLVILKRN